MGEIKTMEIRCGYTKMEDPAKLKPNPKNPNRHPPRQIELLAKILERQGWRSPITVSNLSGFIVRGHGKREAAMKLGLNEVPVEEQEYRNEAEEWADLVSDNKIAEGSEVEYSVLLEVLQEIKGLDAGILTAIGFEDSELENMLKDIAPVAIQQGEVLEQNVIITVVVVPKTWASFRSDILGQLQVLQKNYKKDEIQFSLKE